MLAVATDTELDNMAAALSDQMQEHLATGFAGVGVSARDGGPELLVYVYKTARLGRDDVPEEFAGVPVRVVRIAAIRS